MIPRHLAKSAKRLFEQYPIVTITGPRQSGKTTLVRNVFNQLPYINLEHLETRDFAFSDPVGFVKRFSAGAVIDEVQRVPALLSQLQVLVDKVNHNGQFVLTGSSQFELLNTISQSLAGRTALLKLLPFSLGELTGTDVSFDTDALMYRGFYPRIYDQNLDPTQALGDYVETYIERDVRQFAQIRDLRQFRQFLKLCAGRVGCLLNLSSLSADVGVSSTTIKHWLSILEASYIVFLLPPFHTNIRKRLVKSPKLYFFDVGLASYLLGIDNPIQVETYPLRGGLFENLVIVEMLKYRLNQGKRLDLHFYRDARGQEVDVIVQRAQQLIPIEIKSAMTVNSSQFQGFKQFKKVIGDRMDKPILVYAGDRDEERSEAIVTNISNLAKHLDRAGI